MDILDIGSLKYCTSVEGICASQVKWFLKIFWNYGILTRLELKLKCVSCMNMFSTIITNDSMAPHSGAGQQWVDSYTSKLCSILLILDAGIYMDIFIYKCCQNVLFCLKSRWQHVARTLTTPPFIVTCSRKQERMCAGLPDIKTPDFGQTLQYVPNKPWGPDVAQ